MAHLNAVRRSLFATAISQVRTAVITNAVVAAVAAGAMWSNGQETHLLTWLAVMTLVGVVRLRGFATAKVLAPNADPAPMLRAMTWMVWLAGTNGLLWGVFSCVLVPAGNVELHAFVTCTVGAMAAGAVTSTIALPNAGRAFMTASITPLAASYMLGHVSWTSIALGGLILVYLCVLLGYLRSTSAVLAEAVDARLRNEELKSEVDLVCTQLAEAVAVAKKANESKSRFLANMSHEIRTPMNAVLGLATTLLDESLQPDHHRSVGAIRDSAEILLRLINEILDFSQIEARRVVLESAPFLPLKLVDETISIVGKQSAAKGIAVEIDWDETIPACLCGDAGRVRQVLVNLVGNAVKFTEQGCVTIAVRRCGSNGTDATVEWQVKDTGIGISPEGLSTLFQDFSQADASISRRYGGSGLGLAISRRLVEMMGGTITAQSTLGFGSVFGFRLTLPLSAMPAASVQSAGATDEALQIALRALGRRMRVLLAEDNRVNQIVAQKMLQSFDIDLDIANNGLEAVDAAGRIDYDLIYMDMQMPEMDGPEAALEIRRRAAPSAIRVPIVAFSANAFADDIKACREAGMDDFITKPVQKAVFVGMTLKALTRDAMAGGVVADFESPHMTSG